MTVSTVPSESKTVSAADRPDADRMDLPGQHRPATPGPRTSKRRGLLWLVFLLMIAGVAGYAVWRAGQPIAPQRAQGGGGGRGGGGRGGGGLGPVPVVVAEATRSSIPVISQRARQRDRVLHGDGQVAGRRPADEGGFQRRRLGQGGAGPRRDRPAALSGSARTGAGDAGARPGAAGQREGRSRALQDTAGDGRHSETAAGYADRAGGAATKAPSSRIPPTSTTPSCNCCMPRSRPRSRVSSGCASWIPATSSTPPTRPAWS